MKRLLILLGFSEIDTEALKPLNRILKKSKSIISRTLKSEKIGPHNFLHAEHGIIITQLVGTILRDPSLFFTLRSGQLCE